MEPQFSAQRDKLYRLYPDARIFTLTVPGVIDISSTELREQLASGTGRTCCRRRCTVISCETICTERM